MNVLSLFDGMSCGQLALNKANIKYDKYYASEIDKYAIDIARKNYPNTIHLGDIQNVKGEDFIDNIDLIFGGSIPSITKKSNKNEYRQLTVNEVEQLQTIPIDYTKGVSNTQRYKMIGNGWTVDVIAHILKGIGENHGNEKFSIFKCAC